MYENGLAVEINPKIAFNLYTKSLESSKEPSPKVYFKLGNCYENGFGIQNINLNKAFECFQKAIELGDTESYARLG